MHTGCSNLETKVLIIGNGPAGIALSAFLSGMHPYYDQHHPHENPSIHEKLATNVEYSLLDQDLTWSSDLNELSQSGRPLSVLYDMLVRPGADTGADTRGSIQWDYNRSRETPHLVIGETPIGGSWNTYDPEMLTVSFNDWLDMPGYTMEEWLGGRSVIKRLPSVAIASYLKSYVKKLGLKKKFHSNMRVTSIKKLADCWITEGKRMCDEKPFMIKSSSVVIACGKTSPKKLELPNEEELKQKIVYDVRSLKNRVNSRSDFAGFVINDEIPSTSSGPVVVVGDGITSVDCVRHCLENDKPVIHVIRRNARQLRTVMLSRLSPLQYSEYTNIYRLMIGRSTHENYQRILEANLTGIKKDCVQVKTPREQMNVEYSTLAVCIGRESHIDQVFEDAAQCSSFLDYRNTEDPSLFAVGAFAGDHFVRFLVGGCLRAAQHILHSPKITDYSYSINNNNNIKHDGFC